MRNQQVDIPKYGRAPAIEFESTTALAEHIRHKVTPQTFKGVTQGDTGLVPRSDKLLDRIETIEKLSENKPRMQNNVVGSLVNVPAYLQGSPMAMRMRRKRDEKAPITICVDTTTSAGISAAIIERRGVAVLALLRKLEAAGHAVTLYVTSGLAPYGDTIFLCAKLDTGPIDLARACWILAKEAMQRQVMFETGCDATGHRRGMIDWPFRNHGWNTDIEAQQEVYAQLLSIPRESVLIVPPVYLNEANHFKHDNNAAEWVNVRYKEASELHLITE
jgi:hypothetical protein